MYVYAHQDLFASGHNVAISLYNNLSSKNAIVMLWLMYLIGYAVECETVLQLVLHIRQAHSDFVLNMYI